MIDILDLHTHTLASGHAYNTIWEMVQGARERKLELLGITEHGPLMPGSCHEYYFSNLKALPREINGIKVLFGTELNILNSQGEVDLSDELLKEMDVVIASLHLPCFAPSTLEENMLAYENAMKNPYVNIIGHPDDGRYAIDYERLVRKAKKYHVLLEINNNSLNPKGFRLDTAPNDRKMLKLCKEYQVPVILGSDAHVVTEVGNHERAYAVLKEVDFPEELVVNRSVDAVMKFLNYSSKSGYSIL